MVPCFILFLFLVVFGIIIHLSVNSVLYLMRYVIIFQKNTVHYLIVLQVILYVNINYNK